MLQTLYCPISPLIQLFRQFNGFCTSLCGILTGEDTRETRRHSGLVTCGRAGENIAHEVDLAALPHHTLEGAIERLYHAPVIV